MPDHKDYQSAMDKVAPSEDWKAATLQKMAAARAGQEKTKAAPRLRVAKKVGVPLAAAAAVALLAVPAALQSGLFASSGGAAAPSAALYSAVAQDEAATSEAAMAEENMQDGMQAKGAPAAPRDFDLGEYEGLPVLVLGDDSAGMGGGVTFVAERLDDIRGNNPTWNITANQLPATLPVWHAQSGEHAGPLTGLLDRTADALGLPLVLDEEEEAPTGYPSPDLWPYSAFGDLMDPEHWDPERPLYEQEDPSKTKVWSVSASGTTVNAFRDGDGTLGDPRAGDEAALALFGELAGIETPGYELCTDVNYYGEENCFQHFCFEAGGATVTERLLNYSFRRVKGNLDGTGELCHFNLIFPPESETVGDYPLRTPEEAKAALQTVLDEEQASGMREYDLSVEQVEGWQLEYAQSSMNPYIQPVYRFWLKTDLIPEDAFYENAGGNVYVSYTVSALPEGYCIPFEEAFN